MVWYDELNLSPDDTATFKRFDKIVNELFAIAWLAYQLPPYQAQKLIECASIETEKKAKTVYDGCTWGSDKESPYRKYLKYTGQSSGSLLSYDNAIRGNNKANKYYTAVKSIIQSIFPYTQKKGIPDESKLEKIKNLFTEMTDPISKVLYEFLDKKDDSDVIEGMLRNTFSEQPKRLQAILDVLKIQQPSPPVLPEKPTAMTPLAQTPQIEPAVLAPPTQTTPNEPSPYYQKTFEDPILEQTFEPATTEQLRAPANVEQLGAATQGLAVNEVQAEHQMEDAEKKAEEAVEQQKETTVEIKETMKEVEKIAEVAQDLQKEAAKVQEEQQVVAADEAEALRLAQEQQQKLAESERIQRAAEEAAKMAEVERRKLETREAAVAATEKVARLSSEWAAGNPSEQAKEEAARLAQEAEEARRQMEVAKKAEEDARKEAERQKEEAEKVLEQLKTTKTQLEETTTQKTELDRRLTEVGAQLTKSQQTYEESLARIRALENEKGTALEQKKQADIEKAAAEKAREDIRIEKEALENRTKAILEANPSERATNPEEIRLLEQQRLEKIQVEMLKIKSETEDKLRQNKEDFDKEKQRIEEEHKKESAKRDEEIAGLRKRIEEMTPAPITVSPILRPASRVLDKSDPRPITPPTPQQSPVPLVPSPMTLPPTQQQSPVPLVPSPMTLPPTQQQSPVPQSPTPPSTQQQAQIEEPTYMQSVPEGPVKKVHAPFLDAEPKTTGRHIARNTIKAQMLGSACDYYSKDKQPVGCFSSKEHNATCQSAKDAIRGTCQLLSVKVPLDHPLGGGKQDFKIYRALDRGTQIKMQLHRARLHYNNACRLFTTCSPHVYDRFFEIIKNPKSRGDNPYPTSYDINNLSKVILDDLPHFINVWDSRMTADTSDNWSAWFAPEYIQAIAGPDKDGRFLNVHSDGKARPNRMYRDEEGKKLSRCIDKANHLLNMAIKHLYNALVLYTYVNYKSNMCVKDTKLPLGAFIFITEHEIDIFGVMTLLLTTKDSNALNRYPQTAWEKKTYIEFLRILSAHMKNTAAEYKEIVDNYQAAYDTLANRRSDYMKKLRTDLSPPTGPAKDVWDDDGSAYEAAM